VKNGEKWQKQKVRALPSSLSPSLLGLPCPTSDLILYAWLASFSSRFSLVLQDGGPYNPKDYHCGGNPKSNKDIRCYIAMFLHGLLFNRLSSNIYSLPQDIKHFQYLHIRCNSIT
jgi:hypothetical protein